MPAPQPRLQSRPKDHLVSPIGDRAVGVHCTPPTAHGHDRKILNGDCTRTTDRTAGSESARIECDLRPSPAKRHLRMQDLSTAESARIQCDFQTSPSKRHLRVQDLSTAAAPSRAGFAHRRAKATRQNRRPQRPCNGIAADLSAQRSCRSSARQR